MRDGNPANRQNWDLVCSACGASFGDKEKIDLVGGHFQQEHPELGGDVHLNTVWVGKGRAPKINRGSGRRR